MSPSLLPIDLTAEGYATAFPDSRETFDRLVTYANRLVMWQRTINLVAPATLDTLWQRHFADSAQLLDLAPPDARHWLDLGTGAGFPGLVLAIRLAGRPGAAQRRMTLVESDQRKAAFLAEVVRTTAIDRDIAVDIVVRRMEDEATRATTGKSDVVTARALAPLPRLLSLAGPYFAESTVGLFLKGRDVEAELVEARRRWRMAIELVPSCTNPEARIVVVRSLAASDGANGAKAGQTAAGGGT
jgi:16S rRNA (guanine527-N7)-methyltransferase